MINKSYKPSMKPEVRDGQIWITAEYLKSLKITALQDQKQLQNCLIGQIICPAKYGFKDTAENRKLLRVEEMT